MSVVSIGLCKCGCGETTTLFRGKYRQFISGHNGKGEGNGRWKGGEFKDKDGYILVKCPDHPFANFHGYVKKHRLIYEQYYNCCLLPWIEIHHINGIKDDNRIENLLPLSKRDHAIITLTKDMSDRLCSQCNGKTYFDPRGWECWFDDENNGWLCRKCHRKKTYKLTGKS